MEPRVSRLLSWAVAGRVVGRGVAAVTLLAVVALVGWPERTVHLPWCESGVWFHTIGGLPRWTDGRQLMAVPCGVQCRQDSSLAALLGD